MKKRRMTKKYVEELIEELGQLGVLRDTGKRRNGQVVWAYVQPDDFRCPRCAGGFIGITDRTHCPTCLEAARLLLHREAQ
jgi:hypothetical protein